jgi:hypothetical protein
VSLIPLVRNVSRKGKSRLEWGRRRSLGTKKNRGYGEGVLQLGGKVEFGYYNVVFLSP